VTVIDKTPRMFVCSVCGAEIGTIRRRKYNSDWITFLDWWGLIVYHGEIPCKCGHLEFWRMNQGTYDVLMGGYLTITD